MLAAIRNAHFCNRPYQKRYLSVNTNTLTAKLFSSRRWPFYLVCIVTLSSQLFTAAMNTINSLIWWGRIDLDLILIGCIDSFVVTSLIAPVAIYMIRHSFNLEEMNRALQREIMERILAEEALRRSELQYQALVETTNTGFVIIDSQGRVLDANAEYVRLSGHRNLADILGRSVIEWTAAYEKEKNAEAVRKCLDMGAIRNLEIDYVDPQGNTIPVEINATLVEREEGPQILSLCRDIGERKKAQQESQGLRERLNRAEKMEALGTMAGGVAHDLNNVLGVVVGYAELLALSIPQGQAHRDYADTILQATTKGATIIQDLLTLARRGVVVEEVIQLNTVVTNFLKTPVFKKLKFNHPQVSFSTVLAEDSHYIKGSSVHLEKTVMNLITNAAESITGQGEVTIRTENRYLDRAVRGYDSVEAGEYVMLTVSDNGAGIPSANQERIFEPFYTKKAMGRSGTGLGLAVVWGTVKDHRGYIDVWSDEGKGSLFTLYFPISREKPEEELKIPVEQLRGGGQSILVVDDVPEQGRMAATMLENLGYRPEIVASGEAAVDHLRRRPADLLILDMIMEPGIDGFETYRQALEINPRQKVVIVSGYAETDRVRRALAMGVGTYLNKPYTLEKIGVAVRDILSREAA